MTEDEEVGAGGPLCGAALRQTANWLDTFDELAEAYFDLLEHIGMRTPQELFFARQAVAGKEQQEDLRRWAAELDAGEWERR